MGFFARSGTMLYLISSVNRHYSHNLEIRIQTFQTAGWFLKPTCHHLLEASIHLPPGL